jgi:uncharacterized protein
MALIRWREGGFYLGEDAEAPQAWIDLHRSGEDTLVIDHTFVSESLRGQGIGALLVDEAAKLARAEGRKVLALSLCKEDNVE